MDGEVWFLYRDTLAVLKVSLPFLKNPYLLLLLLLVFEHMTELIICSLWFHPDLFMAVGLLLYLLLLCQR